MEKMKINMRIAHIILTMMTEEMQDDGDKQNNLKHAPDDDSSAST